MTQPIYMDAGTEYPEIQQPESQYVRLAEAEFAGLETTWPEVAARAWELQRADDGT